jgi:glycosyltransferase involved in cell wall biosynthesis
LEALLDEILKRANSLTFPAERLMRFLLAGLRQKYQQKAHIVPHLGNFWLEVPTHAKNGKFTLLFTGLILRQRVSEAFFQALCRFLNREPSAREAISVQFVGRETSLLKEAVRKYDLVEMVRITPHKPLEEVWPLICQSDVLLLIESPMREGVFMPSKLADYLSSGRPILALSPAIGTVADFLSKGGGIRVDPDNPDQIARALADLYRRWRANRLDELKPPASLINQVAPAHVVPAYETAFQQAAAIA